MLQSHCELQPVQNSVKLQSYFNGARNVLLQAESYLSDDDAQQVCLYIIIQCLPLGWCWVCFSYISLYTHTIFSYGT